MLFIKESEKQDICRKIREIPPILKNRSFIVFFFEGLGTLILCFGICVSKIGVTNQYWTFLISCFLYFGISVAAPFTGGHINPSVTIGLTTAGLEQKKNIPLYVLSQISGAFLGAFIFWLFNDQSASPIPELYSADLAWSQLVLDGVGEFFGTFIFLFGIIYTVKNDYMQGQYFKYFFISLMLLLGRTFSFRQGCLNPSIAIALQFFAAFKHESISLFFEGFVLIVGSIMGAIVAALFFDNFYDPLLKELERKNEE